MNPSLSSLRTSNTNKYNGRAKDSASILSPCQNSKYRRTKSVGNTKKASDPLPWIVPKSYNAFDVSSNVDDYGSQAQLKLFQRNFIEGQRQSLQNCMVYHTADQGDGMSKSNLFNQDELANSDIGIKSRNPDFDARRDFKAPKLSFPSPPISSPSTDISISRTSPRYSMRKRSASMKERCSLKSIASKHSTKEHRDLILYEKNKERRRSEYSLHNQNHYRSERILYGKYFSNRREVSNNSEVASANNSPMLQ